ncbi:hypothetical protein LZC95_36190 [Pendulispora brunnea]|uniref:Glycosyltransferase RgtA/B/C/D-like domain-containing protein n=1 Tax=Pendulispora brunnea TaxID=2905690 RepID=A0ABZ2K424_9BACT
MIGQVGSAFGAWGKPPDAVAWAALALAILFAAVAVTATRSRSPETSTLAMWLHDGPHGLSRRRFLAIGSFVAAFASLGYIAYYLRGGPRIIDATSYFLQGRALSHGSIDWPLLEPSALFRGRFLLFREPNLLSGIFPPGYPLLLAIGFRIGAPMVTGPVLAAGIVLATYFLTYEVARATGLSRNVDMTSRFAAAISIVCVALRYHTADTMSHGACAFAITVAIALALRAHRLQTAWLFAVSGLAIGYVAATRMVSAIPVAIGVYALVLRSSSQTRPRAFLLVALGAIPGLALLLVSQHAATGHWFGSTQLAYYAVSDGPQDCFRYGFGRGIGCVVEHADFVRARLPHGYGVLEAAGTTLRRLWPHTADVLNFEPLFLVLLLPIARIVREQPICRVLAAVVGLQIVAYAPFYFDGNYPGGGARFFADVIPLEHALIALAVSGALPSLPRIFAVLSASALGFALHTAYGHRALADRDGGRPMYEPDLAREKGADHGLIYFDTDHGFNLAYDPSHTASHGIVAVRRRHDDRDRLLYDLLGHPNSHLYRFAEGEGGKSMVDAWTPPPIVNDTYRFEAEAEWPPLAQQGGYAHSIFAAGTGASEDRVLELVPEGDGPAWADIELPLPSPAPNGFPAPPRDKPGTFIIEPRVLRRGTGGKGTLVLYGIGPSTERVEKARWEWTDPQKPTPAASGEGAKKATDILDLSSQTVSFDDQLEPLSHGGGPSLRCRMVLRAQHGAVGLDKTTVKAHR